MEETIGDRIKSKRKEMNMTQLELANELKVTDRAVSKWEQNEGNPDISLLPRIASVFKVSLDYLMTGTEPKKEIVIMSKMELCAKNDDPEMIDSGVPLNNKDENGKTLMDYAKQYGSKKVLKALISRAGSGLGDLFHVDTSQATSIPDIMLTCIPIDREREALRTIYHGDIREKDGDFFNALKGKDDYSRNLVAGFKKVFDLLISSYDALSGGQVAYYFGMREDEGAGKEINCWFNAYPYFIDSAIRQGKKDLAEKFVDQVEAHNKWVDSSLAELRKKYTSWDDFNYYKQFFKGRKLYTLPETVDYLLSKRGFEIVYRINDLLEHPRPQRELKMFEIEGDPSLSASDKVVLRCVDHQMLVPNEIRKLRDVKLVETLINENYVNYYEMVYKLLAKDKKALFKFFIDNGYDQLADLLSEGNKEELLLESWRAFNVNASDELLLRQPLAAANRSLKGSDCCANYNRFSKMGIMNSTDIKKPDGNFLIHVFNEYKAELLNDVKKVVEEEERVEKNKVERAKLVKDLTKDYFKKLLANKDEEMFIIKLCSLFDAILKFDYGCSGEDLCERMNDFFDRGPKSRQCDDGWGYFVLDTEYEDNSVKPWEEKRNLMHMLRIKRNTIVHPEEGGHAELDHQDLKDCLEFVFKANGGHIFDE